MAITYFIEGSSGTSSDSSQGVAFNKMALEVRLTSGTVTAIVPRISQAIHFTWITESGQPNVADWPNGVYDFSFDLNVLDGDTQAFAVLHRADVSSTSIEVLFSSTNFGTVGVKTSGVTIDPAAGNATDKYFMAVNFNNTGQHMSGICSILPDDTNNFIRGPWVAGGENFEVNESVSITLTVNPTNTPLKHFIDSTTLAETFDKQLTKHTAESLTVTETFNRIIDFARSFTDSATLNENITNEVLKHLVDSTTLTETLDKQVTKSIADSLTLTESITKLIEKHLTDTLTTTETFNRIADFSRSFTDSTTITENIAKEFVKHLAETLTLTEALENQITKSISDSFTISESISKLIEKTLNGCSYCD